MQVVCEWRAMRKRMRLQNSQSQASPASVPMAPVPVPVAPVPVPVAPASVAAFRTAVLGDTMILTYLLCTLIHSGLYAITETSCGLFECHLDESFVYPAQDVYSANIDSVISGESGVLKCFICRMSLCFLCMGSVSSVHKLLCFGCCLHRGLRTVYECYELSPGGSLSLMFGDIIKSICKEVGTLYVDFNEDVPESFFLSDELPDFLTKLSIACMQSILVELGPKIVKVNHVKADVKTFFDTVKSSLSYFTFTYDGFGSKKCPSTSASEYFAVFADCYKYIGDHIAKLPHMVEWASGRGVLVMFGYVGTFTGFHLDYSGAWTVAFKVWSNGDIVTPEMLKSSREKVLCWWLFVKASVTSITLLNEFLQKRENKDILAVFPMLVCPPLKTPRGKAVFGGLDNSCGVLTKEMMDRIVAGVGEEHVFVKGQCNGEVMHPTPGYMHYVLNVDTILKFATECVEPKSYLRTAVSLRVFAPLFGQHMAVDYTNFNANCYDRLESFISKWTFNRSFGISMDP